MFKGAFNVDVLEYGCSEDGTMLQVEKFTNPLSEHLFHYEPRWPFIYYAVIFRGKVGP